MNSKSLLLILLLSTNALSSELDVDGSFSYQRGNRLNTVLGSNVRYKDKFFDTNALYSYSDNGTRIDRRHEVKSNADFPLYKRIDAFAFAVYGMDSKKRLDNYSKVVIGLSYSLYSVGLGQQWENGEREFIVTHRLKSSYENKRWRVEGVAWYIKEPNDYDVSIKGSCKLKITKRLHAGVGVEYSYDSAPIAGAVRGDFLSKFIIGISL